MKGQIQNDLQVEYEAVKRLNAGIETCLNAADNGSRDLLEGILTDEEEHIDYLEGQLRAISEMGIEKYLAQQLRRRKSRESRRIRVYIEYQAVAASQRLPLPAHGP